MNSCSIRSILFAFSLMALLAGPVAPAAGESGEPATLASIPAPTQIRI
jgi:hypothetical protein